MVVDYKGVSFSFKDQKRKKARKRIRLLILCIILACIGLLTAVLIDSAGVSSIEEMLLQNKIAEASKKLENIEGDFFHPDSKKELSALFHLINGKDKPAQEILTNLKTSGTSVDFNAFLVYFSDRAKYRELNIYTDYLVKRGERLPFFQALSATALLDFETSREITAGMTPDEKTKYQKELSIIAKTNNQMASGKIDYIFDVNGLPLAYYDLKEKTTVSRAPGITFHQFTPDFQANFKFYSLTIDLALQKKISHLFRDQYGTFALFNLADNGISAAFSRPKHLKKPNQPTHKNENNTGENAVFSETYEPGSIIKILTLFTYLHSGQPDFFPYNCKGSCPIGGKEFYDWFRHDAIETYDEALAVSCNICFAKMGINLGGSALVASFEKFFFNSNGLGDQFLNFKTGTCNKTAAGNFQLANLAVGLNQISITTFHAGLLSAVIAQNGSIYAPYMIKNRKNLLNLGYYTHPAELLAVAEDNPTFLKVKNAMYHVVEDKRGTGRRSRVDFVRVGLKTGTAGDKKDGLDAVLTGFFPAEKPKYAFAFRLQGVGKAELKGAYFLKNFLNALYHQE